MYLIIICVYLRFIDSFCLKYIIVIFIVTFYCYFFLSSLSMQMCRFSHCLFITVMIIIVVVELRAATLFTPFRLVLCSVVITQLLDQSGL